MSSDTLTAVGLVVNMAGVVTAFFFGFPQPAAPANYLVWGEAPPEELTAHRRRRRFSLLGLTFLGIGFLLQLVAIAI